MAGESVTVKMAEMDVVADGRNLKTILGSCVGIIIRDPERRVSGLAHVMLPRRNRDDSAEGKYADTAIPALLARLTATGIRRSALQAFLIGGAQMFPMGNVDIASIGDQNVAVARRVLQECKIPIVFEDVGGTSGRSVLFDNTTGTVAVKTLQAMARKSVPEKKGGAA
jgi:chemotaxis protein CheD